MRFDCLELIIQIPRPYRKSHTAAHIHRRKHRNRQDQTQTHFAFHFTSRSQLRSASAEWCRRRRYHITNRPTHGFPGRDRALGVISKGPIYLCPSRSDSSPCVEQASASGESFCICAPLQPLMRFDCLELIIQIPRPYRKSHTAAHIHRRKHRNRQDQTQTHFAFHFTSRSQMRSASAEWCRRRRYRIPNHPTHRFPDHAHVQNASLPSRVSLTFTVCNHIKIQTPGVKDKCTGCAFIVMDSAM